MRILIVSGAGGGTSQGSLGKYYHLEKFSHELIRLGQECKLVKESEYAAGFPSKNILEWFSNKKFKKLISEFKKKTGCPVIVNTSFNVRGEPIVCTPEDAYSCFMNTEIDILVIENTIFHKINQSKLDNKSKYELVLD